MKNAILTLLVSALACTLLISAAGCFWPSVTGDTTGSIPSESEISGVLPADILSLLGCGYQAERVLTLAGIKTGDIDGGHYRIAVAGESDIYYDLQIVRQDGHAVIKTAIRIDPDGYKLMFSPAPDARSIDDFQINTGKGSIDLGQVCSERTLIALLGEPAQISIAEVPSQDGSQTLHCETLKYPGLSVELTGQDECASLDCWFISRITITGETYASPRGLQTGVSYKRAVELLGTGDFILCPDSLDDLTCLKVIKTGSSGGQGKQITLKISSGKIMEIDLSLFET